MPDLATLRQRVKDYLIDVPAETENLIDTWINKAARQAQEKHNFWVMAENLSLTTTAGVRTLGSLPADWKERRADPWLHFGTDGSAHIDWAVSEAQMIALYSEDDPDDKGEPVFILETGANFEVFPFPDGESRWDDGEYRVAIPYWAYLAELSQDGDTNWFTDNAEWYLLFFAVAEGMFFNREEERAAQYLQRATNEFERLRSQSKRSRLGRSETLAPQAGVYSTRGGRSRSGRRRLR